MIFTSFHSAMLQNSINLESLDSQYLSASANDSVLFTNSNCVLPTLANVASHAKTLKSVKMLARSKSTFRKPILSDDEVVLFRIIDDKNSLKLDAVASVRVKVINPRNI